MFASSRSFLLTLVAFTAAAVAAPHGGADPHYGITHSHIDRAVEKRFDGARFTYFEQGANACGTFDDSSAWVIALSPEFYNNGAHCFQHVTIQYNGQQVQAVVTDECPGCQGDQIDLSHPLFEHFAPLDTGVLYGQWWYN